MKVEHSRISQIESFKIILPYNKIITIDFFWLKSEMNLKRGKVRFGGVVSSITQAGFNLLLVRNNEEDIYGKWTVALVRNSKLVKPRTQIEPFGFNNSNDILEIERADHAMHIYTVEYDDNMISQIIELISFEINN